MHELSRHGKASQLYLWVLCAAGEEGAEKTRLLEEKEEFLRLSANTDLKAWWDDGVRFVWTVWGLVVVEMQKGWWGTLLIKLIWGEDSRDWLEIELFKVHCQQLEPNPSAQVAQPFLPNNLQKKSYIAQISRKHQLGVYIWPQNLFLHLYFQPHASSS